MTAQDIKVMMEGEQGQGKYLTDNKANNQRLNR